MQWIVDGSVHLTEICTAAKWRFVDCVAGLVAAGLSAGDADVYAGWAFGTDIVYKRSVGDESLSEAQYARISVTASTPPVHSAGPPI